MVNSKFCIFKVRAFVWYFIHHIYAKSYFLMTKYNSQKNFENFHYIAFSRKILYSEAAPKKYFNIVINYYSMHFLISLPLMDVIVYLLILKCIWCYSFCFNNYFSITVFFQIFTNMPYSILLVPHTLRNASLIRIYLLKY